MTVTTITKSLPKLILGLGVLAPTLSLHAQTAGLQGYAGGSGLSGPGGTGGWEFAANSDITVTALGFNADYFLGSSVPVGLWDDSGNLLGEVAVTGSSTLDNGFYYTALGSGIALDAGSDYVIGALLNQELVTGDASSVSTAPEVTYVQDAYIYTGILAYPNITDSGQEAGYFGPNFLFSDSSSVPDGGSTVMLLGLGLTGLGLAKRKVC